MSNIVSATRKLALQKVIANIFGHVDPTQPSVRSARKYLTPLKGPELLSYYPEEFSIHKFIKANPDLKMDKLTEAEEYRFDILASRKRRGKGAPKKGQGRRSSLKKK